MRTIPVCTGNTPRMNFSAISSQNHPHIHGEYINADKDDILCRETSPMHGEYPQKSDTRGRQLETSPHTRGIRKGKNLRRRQNRIIPTYVGNTSSSLSLVFTKWNHPHICGEYGRLPSGILPVSETSPHTWGILDGRQRRHTPAGTIPTMWGIRRSLADISTGDGTIPTCVGNTIQGLRAEAQAENHPHMCGEYSLYQWYWSRRSEPSPHVWGIQIR